MCSRPDGAYLRVLGDAAEPAVVRVRQPSPETLTIVIEGDRREHPRLLALVRRMLGVEVDLTRFYRSASGIPWLHPLVLRMRGVRPPRYPTLWEACVNAIVFQQVSLHAASSIMGRLTLGLGEPVEHGGVRLYPFPGVEQVQRAPDSLLRGAGLSAGKLATLRRVADALESGGDRRGADGETPRVPMPPPCFAASRGSARGRPPSSCCADSAGSTCFPRTTPAWRVTWRWSAGSAPLDVEALLEALGPERGMLYYHLLLARLEAGGGPASFAVSAPRATRRSGR